MKEKKKKNKTLILTTLICLLPLVASALVYDRLPDRMATHWDMDNEVNGEMPKLFAAVLLPIFMAVLNVVTHVGLDHDPKRKNSAPAVIAICKWVIPVASILAMGQTLLWNLGYQTSVVQLVMALCGLLIVVVGNYMPKCRQNYTIGIKLPWTLASEENWNRTHRLAGYLWIVAGLVMSVSGFFHAGAWIIAAILVIMLVPCVYSFYLYTKGI